MNADMKCIRHLLVTTAVLLVGTTAVRAATFNVADGDVAGLIAAIQQANSTPGLDTIILAANGNYTLTQVHNTANGEGANGLPAVVNDLKIVGNGSLIQRGPGRGVDAFRFFYVDQAAELTLENLTLHNGRQAGFAGGGILARGDLILSGCVFSHNLILSGQSGDGGAIAAFGELTVDASRFLENHAPQRGGAIAKQSPGDVTISRSTFQKNDAFFGGAISLLGGSGALTISRSTFVLNGATADGGALSNSSTASVSNSTFHMNHAGGGGGIVNWLTGTVAIVHTTFINNFANSLEGGNVFNLGTLHLSNSLMALSQSGVDCVNSGAMPTNVNNLIGDGTCNPMLSGDPKVAALDDYGGLTETHALLAGSPARDAAATSSCIKSDQRGVSRPVGSACDIGAFEGGLPLVEHIPSAVTRPPFFIQPCDPLRDTLPGTIPVIVLGDERVGREGRSSGVRGGGQCTTRFCPALTLSIPGRRWGWRHGPGARVRRH